MAELDRAGKVLLRRRPAELVRLAHPDVRSLEPVPAEVVTANALADGVFVAREGRRRVLHQVELIAEPSSRAAREVVRRACALFAAFGRPVRITVLYLHAARDGRRAASAYALPLGGAGAPVRIELAIVRVWEDLSAEAELSRRAPILGRLPLIGLMRDATASSIRRATALIRRHAASEDEAADLLAVLFLTSERRFTPRRLRAMMATEELMAKSWLLREAERRGTKAGKELGKKLGEERGKKLGERDARRAVLLQQLRQRFGRVPADVRARVAGATDPQLERWLTRVVLASTLRDVFGRRHLAGPSG